MHSSFQKSWHIRNFVLIQMCVIFNHTFGVMVNDLASSTVDRGFKPRLGKSKEHKLGICCLYT
jgi:hypothetical protein